jgi:uncharacterized protein (TIGR00159 family)
MQLWEWLTSGDTLALILRLVDIGTVGLLLYLLLSLSSDQRTLWLVRGILVLLALSLVSHYLKLQLLNFVVDKLLVGAAVAVAVILQPELRRFLEQLGRGNLSAIWRSTQKRRLMPESNLMTEAIANAVKELSQTRIGALILIETGEPIDERNFTHAGVKLNAQLSKELIQTIFQTTTPLHDGAVQIRGDTIVAAGVILPVSQRHAPAEIGTRHRAAMGIAEQVDQCICIVVSEETGSIAIAEGEKFNRPVTNSDLREFLEERFAVHRPTTLVRPISPWQKIIRQIWAQLLPKKSVKK